MRKARLLLAVLPLLALFGFWRESSVTQLRPLSPAERATAAALRSGVSERRPERVSASSQGGLDCANPQLPGFQFGTVEVPENWSEPEGPKIRIFYYWRPGRDRARAPVVFFNGGPSVSSHGTSRYLMQRSFTRVQDFVFLDQRGTGCSSPYPGGKIEATLRRLLHWGSEAIVRDAEAVRAQLYGERRWRVFGQSYGGLIVHRYLELAPEGVDRAIAHGFSQMRDSKAWFAERLIAQGRMGEAYFGRYPADRAVLERARAAIPATRCWELEGERACGPGVLDSLLLLLAFPSSWDTLHEVISTLEGPDGAVSETALELLLRLFVFAPMAESAMAGGVISTIEIAPGFVSSVACPEVQKMLEERGERPSSYGINECRLAAALSSEEDKLLLGLPLKPLRFDRIAGNLDARAIPFFLFSGAKDSLVPVSTFEEQVELLGPRVQYKSFPHSGHEGFYLEQDVLRAVTSP